MADDLPFYETFFGIKVQDWSWDYGDGYFTNHQYILTKEYFNEGCMTDDYSELTVTGENVFEFFYPHYIKRQYYIEGTAIGQFTLSCLDDSEVSDYTVEIFKIDKTGLITQIGSTGIIIPTNVDFTWNSEVSACDEIVYPFEIEVTPEKEMLENDRLFVRLTIHTSDSNSILYHSNDSTWEDFKIQIPFRGL